MNELLEQGTQREPFAKHFLLTCTRDTSVKNSVISAGMVDFRDLKNDANEMKSLGLPKASPNRNQYEPSLRVPPPAEALFRLVENVANRLKRFSAFLATQHGAKSSESVGLEMLTNQRQTLTAPSWLYPEQRSCLFASGRHDTAVTSNTPMNANYSITPSYSCHD